MLRKPLPHSPPALQEKCPVSSCLSAICLCSMCLGCPSTCGFLCLWAGRREEGLAGARAGFTVSLVPQIRKAERDRKTLDWEIVELTNKLLDARNTINRLEELNVRPLGAPACATLAPPHSPRGAGL